MYSKSGVLLDSREMLKIKLASLVAEAHAIRKAEALQKNYGRRHALPTPFLLNMLTDHRKLVVRKHARLTGIALGFIRGRSLGSLEPIVRDDKMLSKDDWAEIRRMIVKYGNTASMQHYQSQYDAFHTVVAARPAIPV